MLRILHEQAFNRDEELRACFIDLHKAFDHVNWTKLMKIIKGTGINLRKNLVSKHYMNQSVKITQYMGRQDERMMEEECCLLQILFNLYSKYHT